MKTSAVEAALYTLFDEHFLGDEKYGARVHVHKSGARFEDRAQLWVWPRIVSVDRDYRSLNGAELENYVIETTCYVKTQPKGVEGLFLSNLTDEARRLVDSSLDAPAACVLDAKNRKIGVLAFGVAQESRSYGQSVTIGSVAVSGIDFAVLRTTAVLSAAKPDPRVKKA